MYSSTILVESTVSFGPLTLPGVTLETPVALPPATYLVLCSLLVLAALLVAGYFARDAFDSPIRTAEDDPAPPRYMTQRRQYQLGLVAYIGLCLIGYALIVIFYRDLSPFIAPLEPDVVRSFAQAYVQSDQMSFPMVVVLGVAALVILLRIEHEWNPFFILRRVVRASVSIPELANCITVAARDQLAVPADERTQVASDPNNHIDIGDFDKDKQSVDRVWAELCYLRRWLTRNRDQGPHLTFFNEPSFAWDKLERDFGKLHRQIVPLKHALEEKNAFGREFFEEIASRIEKLRRQYCRLLAYFIVFKNDTKRAALRDAKDVGVRIENSETRANPLPYVLLFAVTILISINLGVWLSAVLWDLFNPAAAAAAAAPTPADVNLTTRWVYYGLVAYGTPIAVALLLRLVGWSYDHEQPSSYLNSYATIFITALCVSVAALSLATEFSPGPNAGKPFLDLLYSNFKWGWVPALICVYVVYHVDRQIDPLLPDVGTLGGEGIAQRLLNCLLFACVATSFAILPTASLSAGPDSAWPTGKLHVVVIGTIFTLAFLMALVSQFGLVKPAARKAEPSPAIGRAALRPF
jgi:hypothetical protein